MTDQNNWTEFMRFVPGFDFLKNLAPPTASAAASAGSSASAFQQWLAPTMDETEIQKRIDELKVVQFWLEQNTRALEASIQALEVQKSTVATLKSMHAGMQYMHQTFADSAGRSAQSSASAVEPELGATAASTSSAQPLEAEHVDKVPPHASEAFFAQAQTAQWWTALTEQFQAIASKAMEDIGHNVAAMQQESPLAARGAELQPAPEPATNAAGAVRGAAVKDTEARAGTKRSAGTSAANSRKSKPAAK